MGVTVTPQEWMPFIKLSGVSSVQEKLEANGKSEDEFRETVVWVYLLSLAQSFLLIEPLKVIAFLLIVLTTLSWAVDLFD